MCNRADRPDRSIFFSSENWTDFTYGLTASLPFSVASCSAAARSTAASCSPLSPDLGRRAALGTWRWPRSSLRSRCWPRSSPRGRRPRLRPPAAVCASFRLRTIRGRAASCPCRCSLGTDHPRYLSSNVCTAGQRCPLFVSTRPRSCCTAALTLQRANVSSVFRLQTM